MTLLLIITLGLIPVAFVTYHIWDTYKVVVESNSYTMKLEDNNDEKAIRDAICLVEKSQKSLFMYDDGDNFPQSIYADNGFIDALKNKLKNNSDYEFQVFFSCKEGIGKNFAANFNEFIKQERVKIYFPKEAGNSADRFHYKIADDGDIMYFSEHEQGSPERKTALLEKNFDLKKSKIKNLAETYKNRFREMCRNGNPYMPEV